MLRLRVIVRLHDSVIEDRVVDVHDRVWLGDSSRAEVAFPGAHLLIENESGELWLRGKALRAGEPVTVFLGPVTLLLEPVGEGEAEAWEPVLPLEFFPVDVRVLVATAAVALFGAFIDSMARFVETDHQASELIAALIAPPLAVELPNTRTARMPTPDASPPAPDASFYPPVAYRPSPPVAYRPDDTNPGVDPLSAPVGFSAEAYPASLEPHGGDAAVGERASSPAVRAVPASDR